MEVSLIWKNIFNYAMAKLGELYNRIALKIHLKVIHLYLSYQKPGGSRKSFLGLPTYQIPFTPIPGWRERISPQKKTIYISFSVRLIKSTKSGRLEIGRKNECVKACPVIAG